MHKKLLILASLLLLPFIAFAQTTVPQGGTGTTTFPSTWFVVGNSALRLTATGTPFFTNFSFINGTGTSATTTSFFSTTASTSNFYGAGLSTCQSNNVLTYNGSGKFGCEADDTGSSASFPFTPTSWGNSTSSTIGFTQGIMSNASSTFTASTTIAGVLTASGGIYGNLTGLASLATALNADGGNCSAGQFPLGVDTLGAVQSCTDAWTEAENTAAAYISDGNTLWDNSYGFITWPFTVQSYGQSTSSVIAFTQGLISQSSTTIPAVGSGLVGANNGLLYGFASSSIFGYTPLNPTRQLTVAGTANQITSSAGAQDLSADRTWTLSLPNHVIFPGNFRATDSTTTNATTTSLNVIGQVDLDSYTSALLLTGAGGIVAEYAGTSCTNQFVRSLNALGASTCADVASTDFGNVAANTVLANGTGASAEPTFLATSSLYAAGTPGQVLGYTNGVWAPVSTTSGAAASFPFTPTTNFGALANSTSTPIWFTAGLQASSTSRMSTTTFEGNVGIGSTSPMSPLSVVGTTTHVGTIQGFDAPFVIYDNVAAANAVNVFQYAGTSYFCGIGNIIGKQAFRGGCDLDKTHWTPANSGFSTFAYGDDVTAKGAYSAAFGNTSSTSADYSFVAGRSNSIYTGATYGAAFGRGNSLYNEYSFAAGQNNSVKGTWAAAIGSANTTNGAKQYLIGASNTAGGTQPSFIFGDSNTTADDESFVIGQNSAATAFSSFAIGTQNSSSGSNSYTIGADANASAPSSYAFGEKVRASGTFAFALGFGVNATDELNNTTPYSLGLGVNSTIPTVLITNSGGVGKTGNVGIATTSPYASLSIHALSTDTIRTTLFAIGSSTASATSTLFSINNIGLISGLDLSLSGGAAFVTSTTTGKMTIPVGSSVITPIAGNIAIDTTTGQLRYSDVTGTTRVVPPFQAASFSYSTTTAFTGTTTIPLGPAAAAETWASVSCFTDTGTLQVSFNDGTNRMNFINASTTANTNLLSTNNTFTLNEKRYVDVGTPASSPTKVSCTVKKSYDAD